MITFPFLQLILFTGILGLPLWCNQATGLSEELVSCPKGHGLRERKGRSAYGVRRDQADAERVKQ